MVGFRAFEQIARPSKDIIERLAKFAIPFIADAMRGACIVDSAIRPVYSPIPRIAGPAVTARVAPGDALVLRKAMEVCQPGDIIVVDGGGETKRALWGGVCSLMMKRRGVPGAIFDGAVRDIGDTRKSEFAVFARAITPRGPELDGPGEVNIPISCGGVCVHPGDIVLADEEGIAIIPPRDAEDVLRIVEAIAAKEEVWEKEADQGQIVMLEFCKEVMAQKGMSEIDRQYGE